MKKHLLFFSLLVAAMACKPQENMQETKLTAPYANFQTTYEGTPVLMNEKYTYEGKSIIFTRFNFFLSNTFLQPSTVVHVTAPENINWLEWTNIDNLTAAQKGINITNIMDGTEENSHLFNQIALGFGVDSVKNAQRPSNYTGNSEMKPLAEESEYWLSWKSYIFSKLEAKIDKDGDGKYETGVTLHTGGNQVFKAKTYSFSAKKYTTAEATLSIKIDLKDLLRNINLDEAASTHTQNSLPVMKQFAQNFVDYLQVK